MRGVVGRARPAARRLWTGVCAGLALALHKVRAPSPSPPPLSTAPAVHAHATPSPHRSIGCVVLRSQPARMQTSFAQVRRSRKANTHARTPRRVRFSSHALRPAPPDAPAPNAQSTTEDGGVFGPRRRRPPRPRPHGKRTLRGAARELSMGRRRGLPRGGRARVWAAGRAPSFGAPLGVTNSEFPTTAPRSGLLLRSRAPPPLTAARPPPPPPPPAAHKKKSRSSRPRTPRRLCLTARAAAACRSASTRSPTRSP